MFIRMILFSALVLAIFASPIFFNKNMSLDSAEVSFVYEPPKNTMTFLDYNGEESIEVLLAVVRAGYLFDPVLYLYWNDKPVTNLYDKYDKLTITNYPINTGDAGVEMLYEIKINNLAYIRDQYTQVHFRKTSLPTKQPDETTQQTNKPEEFTLVTNE